MEQNLIQVGWLGPYGIIPGGMDNDPHPNWQPVYRKNENQNATQATIPAEVVALVRYLEELFRDATPGTWKDEPDIRPAIVIEQVGTEYPGGMWLNDYVNRDEQTVQVGVIANLAKYEKAMFDAAFIVALRNAWPTLRNVLLELPMAVRPVKPNPWALFNEPQTKRRVISGIERWLKKYKPLDYSGDLKRDLSRYLSQEVASTYAQDEPTGI